VIVHTEEVMGTIFSFHLDPGPSGTKAASAAIAAACARLHELDAIFSTFKPNSPMSLLRTGLLGPVDAPGEMALVLELCERARKLSRGWFDPWAMPGGLDPAGLVKGWATEQALEILRLGGIEAAMVNGGGDIAVLGLPRDARTWRIGIRHPWRPKALACVLEIEGAVATSGCYERGPHLINPKNGRMVFQTASASVVGPSLAMCDALATALVVAEDEGPDVARSLSGYESYLIKSDGTEFATDGIVFTAADLELENKEPTVPGGL
jgi:thiamine biosynthesis lipoprotein